MIIGIFFRQKLKMVILIKTYRRHVSIHCKEPERRIIRIIVKHAFKEIHQISTQILPPVIGRHSKSSDFYCRIATEVLAIWKTLLDFPPLTIGDLLLANLIIQNTKISSNIPVILKYKCVGYALFRKIQGIFHKESVKVEISAVKFRHI